MIDASTAADEITPRSSLPSTDEWARPVVEPRPSPAMTRFFREYTGLVPRILPYVTPHSWVHRPLLYLLLPGVRDVDPDLCHQICFVIARDNSCRYCYGSLRTVLRVAGYTESELDQLETDLYLSSPQGREREALQFALRLSRGRVQDDAGVDALREAGYSAGAIREIAGSAALVTITNRVATMLAVPIDDDLEGMTEPWYFTAVRPVAATMMRGMKTLRPPVRTPLDDPPSDGLAAGALQRLRGTNAGRVVQTAADRWLRPDPHGLPLRTKLLMLSVVAHGLSCTDLKRQVREVLAREFDVGDDAFVAAVEHLRGDALSDRETGLLSLARASIRYEAGDVQRAVREHTQSLTRLQTIQAVATLGLCNALARLHALPAIDASA